MTTTVSSNTCGSGSLTGSKVVSVPDGPNGGDGFQGLAPVFSIESGTVLSNTQGGTMSNGLP
jgi:hypothetical protein